MIKSAVIAGTGNVGTHLARALKDRGIRILQLYNRTPAHAIDLSAETGAPVAAGLDAITPRADLYIFSVNDSSLPSLARDFPHKHVFVAHTSGSVPLSVFGNEYKNRGVLYPLQTFSEEVAIDFSGIPLCIEADPPSSLSELRSFAEVLSGNVHPVSSEQRAGLHLAAVFACNFTNYLYTLAEEIARENGSPFELLRPLIGETARKVLHELPHRVQTGPAVRDDREIIEKHLSMLQESSKKKQVYKLLSSFINSRYRKDNEL